MSPSKPDEQALAKKRRALVESTMTAKNISAAEWARRAGVASGTLYNFLKGRSTSLSARTIELLARAVQVPSSSLMLDAERPRTLAVEGILIRGEVQAGSWLESAEWPASDWREVGVPGVPAPYKEVSFGMIVSGPSMNEVYPDGSIVVCVPLMDFHREPRLGDRVIVQRERAGLYEITVKELALVDGRPALIPRSNNPAHQKAIPIDEGEVEIRAIVIGSYRPEATD